MNTWLKLAFGFYKRNWIPHELFCSQQYYNYSIIYYGKGNPQRQRQYYMFIDA